MTGGSGGTDVVYVKMAESRIVRPPLKLKTILGSCVGIILYDRVQKTSGLVHIMLPRKTSRDLVIDKYADTAIPSLVRRMVARGCAMLDLQAHIAGGANMFSYDRSVRGIGEINVEATMAILSELNIKIVFSDTGGDRGRNVLFDSVKGILHVRTMPKIVTQVST